MPDRIITIADAFEGILQRFNSIDSLSQETKEISVQHARDILEKLRFKAEEEDNNGEKRDIDEEKVELAEMLLKLAKAFLGKMAEIAKESREALSDVQASPVFEKSIDAIGKISYKLRIDVVNSLIRQGKEVQAQAMMAHLQASTPERFKVAEISLFDMVALIEAGISQAELLQKKIAAGLEMPPVQNMPPQRPQPKKADKIKEKIMAAVHEVSGYHTIIGVSEKGLIPIVQEVNKAQEDVHTIGNHKVSGVSEEKLVPAAQAANESKTIQNQTPDSALPGQGKR